MYLIKKGVTRVLSQRVLVGPSKRFVFLYHDVSEPGEFQHSKLYSTSVADFRQQVDFLARNFRILPLDELLSPELPTSRERRAAITFDDGFLSVKEAALPYLSARGIPFAIFVNQMAIRENRLLNNSEDGKLERVNSKRIFLDEDDVRSLSAAGVIVGSHTATHRKLGDCDTEALREEVDVNKLYLEKLTGLPAKYLALPFGKREHYNPRVLEHCRQAGHAFVFSTNPMGFDLASRAYRRQLIPRIALTDQTPAEITFMINRPLLKTIDI